MGTPVWSLSLKLLELVNACEQLRAFGSKTKVRQCEANAIENLSHFLDMAVRPEGVEDWLR